MAGRKSSASNIKMPDVNALFGLEDSSGKTEAKVVEIAIDQLYPFDSHPFRVPNPRNRCNTRGFGRRLAHKKYTSLQIGI